LRHDGCRGGEARQPALKGEVSHMVQILDVMDKALNGKPMSETDYQLKLFAPKVQEKVREHRIKFDRENPIPQDTSIADEVFEAGLELLLEVGAFCTSSGRTITFTEQEVRESLRQAPSKLYFGEGRDKRTLVARAIRRPHGASSAPVEDRARATSPS
jgi:methylamine--corrinoid protein Co-methyltransferase